ncbi:hypothetical protein VEV11M_43940 (plasmid) [Escherichia coli]|nr:hypothetical protein VEV11M_43940 [Escherichia coli]
MCRWDKTERKDDSLQCTTHRPRRHEYRCPAGKPLRSEWRAFTPAKVTAVTKAKTVIYRLFSNRLRHRPVESEMLPNTPNRKIVRSIHEAVIS